uniref:FKBP12-interacting protein of 37 kDa n=1 Tax=Oryza nivara TaxID=4536 RepID=A0A0E0H369_ORYNI
MTDSPSPRLDEEDAFGRDFNSSPSPTAPPARSGEKRPFGDLDDDDEDVFASKKGKTKVEESAPGAATGMILSLRERWNGRLPNQKFKSGIQHFRTFQLYLLEPIQSSEESLKEQLEKAKKREAAFIVTFAKREQEIAELKSAVRDLKTQLRPPSMQTRRLLLDPAIHEEFTRLKNLVEEKEKKIKELQDNVAAVNFTPSSKHGKMLMAKCRTLQEENEEIGAMASEGKEMLAQKEATDEDKIPQENDVAGDDIDAAAESQPIKVET